MTPTSRSLLQCLFWLPLCSLFSLAVVHESIFLLCQQVNSGQPTWILRLKLYERAIRHHPVAVQREVDKAITAAPTLTISCVDKLSMLFIDTTDCQRVHNSWARRVLAPNSYVGINTRTDPQATQTKMAARFFIFQHNKSTFNPVISFGFELLVCISHKQINIVVDI